MNETTSTALSRHSCRRNADACERFHLYCMRLRTRRQQALHTAEHSHTVRVISTCGFVACVAAGDPFEQLVNAFLDNRSRRLSARLGAGVRSSLSRFGALLSKHRRTGSTQSLSGFGFAGASSSRGAMSEQNSNAGGTGMMSVMRPKSGGLSASFAERPESLRMRQMVAAFAAAAEQMRNNLTDSGNKTGGVM